MKISERSYPGAKLLNRNGYPTKLHDRDAARLSREKKAILLSATDGMRDKFNAKAYMITDPFSDAIDAAEARIMADMDVNGDPTSHIRGMSGTLLLYDKITMYRYNIGQSINDSTILMYHEDGLIAAFVNGKPEFYSAAMESFVDKCIELDPSRSAGFDAEAAKHGFNKEQMDAFGRIAWALVAITFIRCADLKTIIVRGRSKSKDHEGQKVVNDLGHDVTLLDTTWFTEIVKVDGFPVKGHFRLQPVGANRQERKLIWIADFKKNGYHRRAGIQIAEQEPV